MSTPTYPVALNDEQRLAWIAEQVKSWRTYVEKSHRVIDGSSLAADDKIFPTLPPSHLIWHGISHAVDHLDMFMNALVENGKAFPLAPRTLARSGILGAAHALWLLDGPDRVERQRRALKIAHEEFQRDRQALQEIADIMRIDSGAEAIADIARVQQQIDTRTDWIARAIAAGATLGMRETQVTAQLDETTIIDTVAKRYAEVSKDAKELVTAYRIIWRTYSGNAHALRWSAMPRAEILQTLPGGGADGRLTSELPDLNVSASAVALFTKRAIDLYEIRRQPHAR